VGERQAVVVHFGDVAAAVVHAGLKIRAHPGTLTAPTIALPVRIAKVNLFGRSVWGLGHCARVLAASGFGVNNAPLPSPPRRRWCRPSQNCRNQLLVRV
jgi:hypothetical protein